MRRIGLVSALLLLSAAFAEQGLRRKRNLLNIQVESEIHHEMISPYNELVLDDFLWGGRKLMKVDGKSKSKGTMDSFSAIALKSTKSPKSTKAGLNSPQMTTVGNGSFSPKSKKKSQKTEDCYSDVFGYLFCDSSMSFMSMSVSMSMVATPTMPTNPTTPTTPIAPPTPTAPSTPSTPTTPTAPTTPTSPTAPTAPTSPTAPTAPTSPTAPTTPTIPTVPTQAPIDGCSSLPRDEALRTLVGAITDETTLADSTSPQGQAYQWMLNTDPASLDPCTDDNVLPRYALTTFYFSSSGASWTNSSDWLSGTSECAWYGVVCSSTGTVTEIALFENNLAGTLPTELEALTDMQRLDVFDNELGGPIPNILSKWPFLAFFDVEKNQLTGSPFVDAIGLFNLQSYRVSLNAFVGGTIPADLVDKFPNLVELWLSNSTMIGSIPTEIALMDNLQSIFLYGNSLTGTLPSELGQLNLERLQVQDNMFTGRIPTELFRSTNLADLRLDTNKLAGPIPSAVGALTNLIDLRLNNNVLSGTLPTEISRLSNLVFFVLQDNQLTGTFPDAFEPFQALQFVDVSGNNLTGPLPRTVFDVPVIEILYFDDNAFTGTIPGNYANASSLRDLWLNDNQLTGTIPPTRPAELASLEEFRLDGNNLVGTVPLSLCALPSSTALTADCGGPSPAVECVCCTLCVA